MGTMDITAHGDHHIHRWELGQKLAVLGLLHIDVVHLLHQPDGILIDLGFSFRACGITLEHIRSQLLSQSLCDLTAAGVVNTVLLSSLVSAKKWASDSHALVVLTGWTPVPATPSSNMVIDKRIIVNAG